MTCAPANRGETNALDTPSFLAAVAFTHLTTAFNGNDEPGLMRRTSSRCTERGATGSTNDRAAHRTAEPQVSAPTRVHNENQAQQDARGELTLRFNVRQ
jgi:hypothetical protein